VFFFPVTEVGYVPSQENLKNITPESVHSGAIFLTILAVHVEDWRG